MSGEDTRQGQGIPDFFKGKYYKQPTKRDNSDSQSQLKTFISKNGKATKLDNP